MVRWRYVTPGYFAAMGIPIRRGRGFGATDRAQGALSIVLSESLARRLFPGQEAIGRHVLRDPGSDWFTVIGIAGDVKNQGLMAEAAPEYYVVRKAAPDVTFANQEPPAGWRAAAVVMRTPLPPAEAAAGLRRILSEMDPALPVETETMNQRLGELKERPRFQAALLAAFAALGLILAATGVFGVLACVVAHRQREFGIRLALGAPAGRVAAAILVRSARWTVAGILLGACLAAAAGRMMQSLLHGVDAMDGATLLLSTVILSSVALAASVGPAFRAARMDPSRTLREE